MACGEISDTAANSGGQLQGGVSSGFLPDQGGPVPTIGQGNGITVYDAYGVVTVGGLDVEAEYLSAEDHHGVSRRVMPSPPVTGSSRRTGWGSGRP